jgi:hypothetical protein
MIPTADMPPTGVTPENASRKKVLQGRPFWAKFALMNMRGVLKPIFKAWNGVPRVEQDVPGQDGGKKAGAQRRRCRRMS